MLDLFFTLGQVLCLVWLLYGALVCLRNGETSRTLRGELSAADAPMAQTPGQSKPYLFDSLSGHAVQPAI